MLGNFVCFFFGSFSDQMAFVFFFIILSGIESKVSNMMLLKEKNLNWHYTNTCIIWVKMNLFSTKWIYISIYREIGPQMTNPYNSYVFFIHFPHSRHTVLATIFIAIMIIKENPLTYTRTHTHIHSRTFFTHGDFCSDGFYIMLIHQTIYTVYLEIHYNVYIRYFLLNN